MLSRCVHCSCERVASFSEGQEKGGTGNWCELAGAVRFSSTAFCVPVWLTSSQHGEETQIFSLMFFVFLDGNMLISCWWYAFENTWVSIPGVCLKYFKAVKGLSQGSFQIHATSYILYTGGWKCDFLRGESVVYVHVWIVLFMSNFVLSAQMTSASKIL